MSDTPTSEPKLAKALLEVQKEIYASGGATKDADNPYFDSKYVDRDKVIDTILPVLNKHGIVVLQLPLPGAEGHMNLATYLIHAETNERIESATQMPLAQQTPQGYGAAMTYASRYSLVMAVGLKTPGEDDDGETSMGRGQGKSAGPSKPAGGFKKPEGSKTTAPAKFGGGKKTEQAEAPKRGKTGLFPKVETEGGEGDAA